jgi:V-type H+-transporting ATPase subunit B
MVAHKLAAGASGLSAASLHAAAATRDYNLNPRVTYQTITGVEGPLVIIDKVK